MTRFTKDSKFRLRDFKKRGGWDFSTCEIYLHEDLSQSYIPIHPFGDELNTLEELNISKDSCTWVDAYWNMDSDVSFIQVISTEASGGSEVGLFAQWGNTIKEYLTLTAIVDAPFITRVLFEEQMKKFMELGIEPSEKLRLKLSRFKLKL